VTDAEIIDKVYESIIAEAATTMFKELVFGNNVGTTRQDYTERRFSYAIKAAAAVRERAKALIENGYERQDIRGITGIT
jgi:hypothetical protein